MVISPGPGVRRYSYADLEAFPEDNLRREIIDGELIVTASPVTRHQRSVVNFVVALSEYARAYGGEVFPAPLDVFFSDDNVVKPDVLFVRADHLDRIEKKFVRSAPDLVVEVSSPSTRRLEVVRKRDLYSRFGVPEYWYVDLEVDRVEIYRPAEGSYPAPEMRYPGESVESMVLSGFSIPAAAALAMEP
ncbi:MAG TPA: Uma2 family endonuclease [Actinomycetota bacterium]|nr:Uma2 family endonuclease [Actinomycetota bacterium]